MSMQHTWAVGPGPCAGELFQDRLFYVATSQLGRQREEGGDGRTKW